MLSVVVRDYDKAENGDLQPKFLSEHGDSLPAFSSNYQHLSSFINTLAAMKSRQERKRGRSCEMFNSTSAMLCLFILLLLAGSSFSCGPGSMRHGRKNPQAALSLYEKFPNQKETSDIASGRSIGRVRRGSPAFEALVGNYSPDIIFKGDKNEDDRRMTKRCSEKLKNLADKVKQLWPNVQLRVIEAYSDGRSKKHDKNSLHYEGRAVDITTSDKDRRKYGKLGRLAYQAGFDWVYYGWESHIHASVKTDKAGEEETTGCFHGQASVLLENGKRVSMAELRAGDRVQSIDKDGNLVFSPVMLFLDYRPEFSVDFVLIETEEPKRKLAITGTHLIYQMNKQARRGSVVFAKDIQAGDFVYISNGTNGKNLTACRVTKVIRKTNTGVYAPLTEQGNIFVDDILCSCYAVVNHELAHWCFTPVRVLLNTLPSVMKWVENRSEGIHWYAEILRKIYPIWQYVKSF